jgi:hypothetical protein
MTTPRVVNVRHQQHADAIYVGRAVLSRGLADSPFGNPYKLARDATPADRAEVIQKYRSWLLGQRELLRRLHELRGRPLACWCAPEPCHANVLVELVDADEVLDELKAAGVTVEARDDRLRLRPASSVSEALAARVRLHKPAVLELLANRPPLLDLAEDCRQLVEAVAESLRLPPDVLVAETVEQARERQAAAIERLRLDRLAYIEDARRAGVYRGLATDT